MREILFKAVSIAGKWVEGDLIKDQLLGKSWIYNDRFEIITLLSCSRCFSRLLLTEVHPDTVCQFSGLLDSSGKKIFEGDIVDADHWRGEVHFGFYELSASSIINNCICVGPAVLTTKNRNTNIVSCKITGNIHDDKLKGEEC